MKDTKFSSNPILSKEKNDMIKKFVNDVDTSEATEEPAKASHKKTCKRILIRIPAHVNRDLESIVEQTGLSINAICLDSLRREFKRKLKELNE